MSEEQTKGCLYVIGLVLIAGLLFVGYKIVAVVVGPLRVEFAQPNNPAIVTQLPVINQPVNTEIPLQATDTLLPPPAITAMPTPIPTETPLPDTTPGTILEFGQTWRQGGLELTIIQSEWARMSNWMDEGGGVYSFMLMNLESYDRSFRLSSENFTANDNFGRIVPMVPKQNTTIEEYCPSHTIQLLANQTIDLASELLCPQLMSFALTPRIDAGDTSIIEIIVSVSVSDITNARWQIKIHH